MTRLPFQGPNLEQEEASTSQDWSFPLFYKMNIFDDQIETGFLAKMITVFFFLTRAVSKTAQVLIQR